MTLVQHFCSWLLILFLADLSAANTPPLENGDIHDIYGPVALAEPLSWFYYLAGALFVLALFLVWFFLLKKRKPQPAGDVHIHEVALAELAAARKYLEQNLSLKYAQRVSLILRKYLERRFEIHSTRQTTHEFLASFDQSPSSSMTVLQPYRESLQVCLEQFDLAKYAHKTAQRETMEHLEESIRTFIRETTPRESE